MVRTHTVVAGETLSALALRFYGDAELYRLIATASGVANPNVIRPGQRLIMPDGDKRVFADPDIEAMFIDDIVLAARGGFQAMVDDGRLFGRDWGFRLTDIAVPVRWWHGDADAIIPLDDAKQAISYLSNVELILMPDESHLGGFAAADEVLTFLRSHL